VLSRRPRATPAPGAPARSVLDDTSTALRSMSEDRARHVEGLTAGRKSTLSWNRTKPIGARVMFTSLKPDGTADKTEVFAEGWLTENGEYLGRPVDVAMLLDGSLLVSDDTAGAIYRIFYDGP